MTSRREYGWNDPPQFSYEVGGANRTTKLLNKRPNYPADQIQQNNPSTTTDSSLPPPPLSSSLPPPLSSSPTVREGSHVETTHTTKETTPTVLISKSDVIPSLNELIEHYKDKIEDRVYKEVKRRLDILERQWDTLNTSVHNRMSQLVKALEDEDFKKAESIHVALMVDHVTEVKQWLIGVKKLVTIATEHHSTNE